MPEKLVVGDRIMDPRDGEIIEVSESRGNRINFKSIANFSGVKLTGFLSSDFGWKSSDWQYLGNFSKIDNVKSLYDKLTS